MANCHDLPDMKPALLDSPIPVASKWRAAFRQSVSLPMIKDEPRPTEPRPTEPREERRF